MAGKRRAQPPPGRRRGDSAPSPIATLGTRRQQRLERRARRRRLGRWGIVGLVAVGVIVAAAIGFGVHSITQHTTRRPSPDQQTTVLLQVSGTGGTSAGGILLAHDRRPGITNPGVEVMVPPSLFLDVCGLGQTSFGDILAQPGGAEQAAAALSAQLENLRIDGTWTLTGTQLAALVSAVGGITVDVDVNVTRPGRHGTSSVEIPRGQQQLSGSQAAEYATYRAGATEDATAQMLRLQRVVQAAVDKLSSVSTATSVLDRLHSATSLPVGSLAQLLVELAGDDKRDGGVLATNLPTNPLPLNGGSPAYNLDTASADKLMHDDFAPSLPPARVSGAQVLLKNGLSRPGLIASACQRLTRAGIQAQGGGNLGTSQPHSEILVNARTVGLTEQADAVARALRLPDGDVAVNPIPTSTNDQITVVLGSDYKP